MLIRRTKTRTTESGEHYYSHRIVDTYRVGERVSQRTLLNLGSDFHVPREQWSALSQRIEQIVLGQQTLLPPSSPEVERDAQNLAAQLLDKYAGTDLLLSPEKAKADAQEAPATAECGSQDQTDGRDLHCVDLNSLELMSSRSIGGEAVALSA